ncbi:major facilitator superfamily domain-containing protein [Triangularia verruculosa]|uniref:Major facilitator superfamily domain-containing protein n=1 Tax=Triangularia verruculosa TaxID=2587418 RepID=A0AAN6XPQ5_9PEZI|nr:major facilitator superfamily domain-containing protein [Triangularia verruculosa]
MVASGFWQKRSLTRLKDCSKGATNAASLTFRQSIFPICLVTILFFLWGFSYGLLDTLNKHFQNTLKITRSRSSGLQVAYFGAYPIASLGHAAWILRHYGYRATFIWGLFLYGLGALLCIPAIMGHSFSGFCFCIFIIGNGLGSLETAANPYITVCGPPKQAELRINLAQAFNGIGGIVAPLLGSYVFFGFDNEEKALQNVQWVYMSIAIFVFFMATVFFLAEIPEITDEDMALQEAEAAKKNHEAVMGTEAYQVHVEARPHAIGPAPPSEDQPFRKQYRLFHAAFSEFCYTGAQVAVGSYFINYVTETRPNTDSALAAKFLAGAQAAFAVGRFIGVGIMTCIRPRKVLLVFMTMCWVFTAPAITQRGNVGMSMLYVVLFFESICFPTIVALGMRGLGRHTKRGSGWIIAGVCGGAVVPPLLAVVADSNGGKTGTAVAMVVPMVFFLISWTYAMSVNFWGWYRRTVDAFAPNEETAGRRGEAVELEKKGDVDGTGVVKPVTDVEKMSDVKLVD